MNIVCPYCNIRPNSTTSYQTYFYYACSHHSPIKVEVNTDLKITYFSRIVLSNFRYYIFIHPLEHNMLLYRNCSSFIQSYGGELLTVLPIDNNLNPDNFEKKLQTYLTFQ